MKLSGVFPFCDITCNLRSETKARRGRTARAGACRKRHVPGGPPGWPPAGRRRRTSAAGLSFWLLWYESAAFWLLAMREPILGGSKTARVSMEEKQQGQSGRTPCRRLDVLALSFMFRGCVFSCVFCVMSANFGAFHQFQMSYARHSNKTRNRKTTFQPQDKPQAQATPCIRYPAVRSLHDASSLNCQ